MHLRLKSTIGLLLTSLLSAQPLTSQTPSAAKPSKTVTGHYRLRHPETPNSLEVLQLPAGKIQFHLLASGDNMRYRQFGRTGWEVSEIGYGMWGMGGWSNSDDHESLRSLQAAVNRGCNFFDTAYVYGDGRSENLLGQTVRANRDKRFYTATKVPPRNKQWPARPEYGLQESYPPDHVEEFVHRSLENARLESFDLMQFHTWNDEWLRDDRWLYKLDDLRSQRLIRAIGISLNRWEPWNGVRAVRTGQIDSVQVIYNIFDQNPEDDLFPACEEMNVAVIARVPFDEGTLTGTLTKDSKWPEGDWRTTYFVPENLIPSVERADALKELLRDWNREHSEELTMPEMALRFILTNPTVSTIIPGMRKLSHVESNIAASDAGPLPAELYAALRKHRWVRKPTPWSQ
ncbi:MAG TPA: aldo/keto reductase [Pyrinomonadaceae bacterium]|nr:aldo/keto reductase [Pyrinomonadaceae bacterium]